MRHLLNLALASVALAVALTPLDGPAFRVGLAATTPVVVIAATEVRPARPVRMIAIDGRFGPGSGVDRAPAWR